MRFTTAIIALLFAATGCRTVPFIRTPEITVEAPRDAGKPATVDRAEAKESFDIPAGTTYTAEHTQATPQKPATLVERWDFTAPTRFERAASSLKADTGTIDTSVAVKRIEVAERRWLLFVAIGCGIAGLVIRSMLPAWPGLSNGLLAGAVFAFAAWKLAEIPTWLWAVAIGIVGVMALGYKRAQWDKDGDGRPDFLQK